MAIFNPTLGDIRGSIGGITFSAGAFGSTLKRKTKTPRFTSPSAFLQKSRFKYLSQYWSAKLTQSDRDAWDAASPNFPHTNSLGQTIYLTGFNLFEEFNGNLLLIEEPIITLPPTPTLVPPPTSIVLSCDIFTQELWGEIFPNPVDNAISYVVFGTNPYRQGISNFQNRLRFAFHTVIGGGGLTNVWNSYVAKYGLPIAGMKISAICFSIDKATGIRSGTTSATITIENNVINTLTINPVTGSFAGETTLTNQSQFGTANMLSYTFPNDMTIQITSGNWAAPDTFQGDTTLAQASIITIT